MCGAEVPSAVTSKEGPAFIFPVATPRCLVRAGTDPSSGLQTYGLQTGYEPNTLSILHWADRLSNTAATLASCR